MLCNTAACWANESKRDICIALYNLYDTHHTSELNQIILAHVLVMLWCYLIMPRCIVKATLWILCCVTYSFLFFAFLRAMLLLLTYCSLIMLPPRPNTSSSAMAEGPRDAIVSRNSATTKHPIWKLEYRAYRVALFSRFHTIPEWDRHTHT